VKAAGRGTREAHLKHVAHGRDAGGVEAQRLVERRRALPRPKGSIGRGATCGQGKREGVEKRRRREQRAGRTQVSRLLAGETQRPNLKNHFMFVTLEVS
jgi:hypothetical protein